MIVWVFEDEILVNISKVDSKVLFSVIYLFFTNQLAQMLKTNDNDMFLYFCSEDNKQIVDN